MFTISLETISEVTIFTALNHSQVGALAARRAKEKAHDRRRRMSLDKAPHTLDQSSFTSLKESSMRAKRGASPDLQTVNIPTSKL